MIQKSCFVLLAAALAWASACVAPPRPLPPRERAEPARPATGDEIVICGERFHVGAPVVLWDQVPAYDATSPHPRFAAASSATSQPEPRYEAGRWKKRSRPNPEFVPKPEPFEEDPRTDEQKLATIALPPIELVRPGCKVPFVLAQHVDQFVLHYDACGLSQTCFRVLHDERNLSVHFLLDVDGTIYQTIDLRDTCWHATKANSRSIGIEIAHIGAFRPGDRDGRKRMEEWYGSDGAGPKLTIPARYGDGGVRTPGYVGRPRNPELVTGSIHGEELVQRDFTVEQYDSLVKLAAVLCRELPKIAPDAPRGSDGRVLDRALSDEEFESFRGILGHFHVQENKTDPGPAFDWERFLADVRKRIAEIAPANEVPGA